MTADRLRFGSYEALFELAAGGMATVYLARKVGPGGFERLVVLKRMHRHLLRDRELCGMLRDEAKIASLVVHPNVVGVDDVVEAEGELLLAQPYVESVPLSALLRAARDAGERLPPAVVVRVLSDVLAGLHAAHEARDMRGEPLHVVHRDVSPHNVLVGTDGRSRLIDFGIAKAERRVTHTKSGVMKGKLAYMAPEALRQVPLDRRADVFAAGVMLHEALTGERLFDGEDEADVLLSVMVTEPEPPSTIAPGVPEALDRAALAALERKPDERTGTAAEMLEALERALAPAPPRDVAALVDRLCGERIAAQRVRVVQAIDSPSSAAPPGGVAAGPASAAAAEPATNVDVTEVAPRSDQIPSPRVGATVVEARQPRAAPRPRPEGRSRVLLAVGALGLLGGAGAALGLRSFEPADAPSPSSSSSAPSALPSSPIPPSSGASASPSASVPAPPGPPASSPVPPSSNTVRVHVAPPRTSELHKNPYAKP